MAYSAQINRTNPTCIVFLVDQSASMAKSFGAQPDKKKSDGVADAINRLLQTLCIKCGRADGIREYFQIGVIGYGLKVQSAMGGNLGGRGLVSIGEIASSPLRVENRTKLVEDGVGGVIKQNLKFPVWFEPVANGKTPMRQALELAKEWVSGFLTAHPDCYPPLVVNLTDGEANDGDPSAAATALRQLSSSDGNVLLFNAHISERNDPPIMFPEQEQGLPNDFAKQLFRMSSELPPRLVEVARQEEFTVGPASRGFAFNADLVAVIRFLDIGTQQAKGATDS
ncbi:MAG: VWA domain-containing protein [Planctomycetales bacterium]|nr:VWA domain-containing protein [Planctomycetales bacterium]